MQLGVVILPELRAAELQSVWRSAEQLGFDHAWTYDHLAWRSLRDSTWFGAVPTLAAAALATARIRIGMLVAFPVASNDRAFPSPSPVPGHARCSWQPPSGRHG